MMSFEPLDLATLEANKFFLLLMLVQVGFLSLNIKTRTKNYKDTSYTEGAEDLTPASWPPSLAASLTASGDFHSDPNSSPWRLISVPLFIFHFCSQRSSHGVGISAPTIHSMYLSLRRPSFSLPSLLGHA